MNILNIVAYIWAGVALAAAATQGLVYLTIMLVWLVVVVLFWSLT